MINFLSVYWPYIVIFLGLISYVCYLLVTKQWEKLRKAALDGILYAEKTITGTKKGQERFQYVLDYLYGLLPVWLRIFVTEEMLKAQLQKWFDEIVEYLTYGKTIKAE